MEPLPPFSKEAQSLKPGIYKHFKGNTYRVLGVARHSETLEEFVVYQAHYGNRELWVRPLTLFIDEVEHNDTHVRRFEYLGE